jgi:hypothetical protein
MKRDPEHEHQPPEPWVTKRQLADHLSVTPRWIELQQPLGLPRLSTGGMNRYRISEVEAWATRALQLPLGDTSATKSLTDAAWPSPVSHRFAFVRLRSIRPNVFVP